jgi:hypothetical protein
MTLVNAITSQGPGPIPRELAVFDPAVPDLPALLDGLRDGVEVILLDPRQDPLEQLAAAAAARPGLGTLHVIAHGAPGEIRLGGRAVTAATLDAAGPALRRLGETLADDGRIALWSCETGAGPEGAAFCDRLARETGAAVGASTRPIGAGGPWLLDRGTGAAAPIPAAAAEKFTGLLALPSVRITSASDNAAPVTGNVAFAGFTNDTTPTFSGLLSANLLAGQSVLITAGSVQLGAATVNNLDWTFTPTSPLPDGKYFIYAYVVDSSFYTVSTAWEITIDTVAPTVTAAIAGAADDIGTIQGIIAAGGITNDTTPTLSGTLSGGISLLDERVAVYDGATRLGFATVSGTTWTYTTPALGQGAHSFTVRVEDAAGNQGSASTARTLTVDSVAPTATVAITGVTDDVAPVTGTVAAGGSTNDTTPTLSGSITGTLGSGEVVAVYDGAARLGTATVSGATWTYTTPALGQGAHSFTVRVEDAVGNQGAASAARTLTLDTTAPAATLAITDVADDVAPVTGSVAAGGSTNDTTPTLSGSITGTLGSGEVVAIYDGSTRLGTAMVSGTTWTYTTPALGNGGHSFTARVEDAAGNQGAASAARTLTVDTVAPVSTAAITGVTDNVAPVSGSVAEAGATNDTTPTLSGTLSTTLLAGEVVGVYDGATRLGAATVSGTTWSFTTSALADGGHSFTVLIEDAAGNRGTASAARTLTVDTVVPTATAAITGVADDVAPVTGTVAAGGVTNDPTPTLTGSITGTLAANEVVAVYDGATKLGAATVSGATWTYTTPVRADGAHSFTVRIEDAAGNQGTVSAARTMTVDSVAPTATASITNAVADLAPATGTVAAGGVTNDPTPTLSGGITGTLAAGEVVVVYDGATRLGTATVSGTTWSYTPPTLGNGAYSFTARVEDAAGNQGVVSTARTLTVSTGSAPTATAAITDAIDDVALVTGSIANGASTNDAMPTLSGSITGTLGLGEVVAVYDGATKLGAAAVSGATWTYTTPVLGNTAHSFTVRVEDKAGLKGTASAALGLTVDAVAPTATAAITDAVDDVGIIQGSIAAGGLTNDATPTLTGSITGTLGAGEVVAVYDGATKLGTATVSGTTWTYATPTRADGAHSFTVQVEDAAGNRSTASVARTMTVDTVVPRSSGSLGSITDSVGWLTGNLLRNTGVPTDDPTLTLSGFHQNIDTYRISIYDNGTILGYASPNSQWSFATPTLANGQHTFAVYAEDRAGNQSPLGAATIRVDTNFVVSASITSAIDDVGAFTGTIPSTVTDDPTPTLSGTMSVPLSGQAQVAITDRSSFSAPIGTGNIIGYATVTGTTWTFTTPALSNGTHFLSAHMFYPEFSGALSPPSTRSLTVDVIPPTATASITSAVDDASPITGAIAAGGATDDTTPTLSGSIAGTLGVGEVVAIYDGATRLGTTTVSGATWTYTTPALAEGAHSFTARVEDAAGNQGAASAARMLTVDTVAPTATAAITGVTDNVGIVQGAVAAGGVTDDATPRLAGTITGALGAGEVVAVYDGAARLGAAAVSGATWSYTTGARADGAHSFTVRVEDAAGNQGAASAARILTVDTAPPATTATITGVADDVGIVQGQVAAAGTTDDPTPTLTGTLSAALAAGEAVGVYAGAARLGAASVSGTGWSFTTPTLGNGAYSFTARVEDAAGNQGAASTASDLTVGTGSLPAATAAISGVADNVGPVTGTVAAGGATNDATPTLSGSLNGTLGFGEVVAVYDGATRLGAATVSGATWSYTTAALAEGAHSFTARVEDLAGNQGAASAARTLTVDTVVPTATAAITGIADNAGIIQGQVAESGATDDATPTLSGSIAGTLGAGEVVAVYVGATRLGAAAVSGATWNYTTGTQADGVRSFMVRVEDAAGNQGAASAARTLTVDTVAPTATATITGATDDVGTIQGAIPAGGVTNDATPTLMGTITGALAAGEVVAVYDGAARLGAAAVSGATWTYTTPARADGVRSFTVRVEDAAGNQGAASAARTLTVDTVVPTASITGVADDVGPVLGGVAAGGATNDAMPTLSGTLSAAPGAGDTVSVLDGATVLGAAAVSGTTWTFTPATPLAEGAHSFTLRVADAAGNVSTSAARTLTVDTAAPTATAAITGVADNVGPVTGTVAAGGATNDATPTLSGSLNGTLGIGEVVAVYDGATRLGAATVSGATWSYTTAALAEGAHSLTARVEDAAGNQGAASAARTLTVDTVVPTATAAITGIADNAGIIQGAVAAGGVTDDATPMLTGSITGTLGAGEVAAVYLGATRLGAAVVSGATWSYTTGPLADGAYSFTVRVEDAAGNQGAASTARTLTVDTAPPATTAVIAGVTDDVGAVTGTVAAGGTTDDGTPTLSGTLSAALAAGEAVGVYAGSTRLGAAAVSGTGWSYTTPTLGNGAYSFTVRVEDAVGNQGAASTVRNLTVGTGSAPAATTTITGLADNVGIFQGQVVSGGTTNDATPTLTGGIAGALGIGEVVAVYDGATRLGAASVSGATWSYTTAALAEGAHSFTVRVVDAAGNQGAASAARTLIVDTAAPTATAAITDATDNAGIVQGAIAPGGVTDDATPTLMGTITGALAAGEVVAVYNGATRLGAALVSGATWTYTTPARADGAHSFTVRVEDGAGNQGAASAARTLTVDTAPPATTAAITGVADDVGTILGAIPAGGATDDTTPTLSGTLSAVLAAGETVGVYDGAARLGAATVSGTGWTYTTPTLGNGEHSFTARVEDAAGNQGATSAARTLTVDTALLGAIAAITFSDDPWA